MLQLTRREFDAAEAAGRRALAFEPSSSEIHALLAQMVVFRGKWDEAIALGKQAIRLSPRHPSWYLIWPVLGHVYLGEPALAIPIAQRMVETAESPPQRSSALEFLAFALAEAGRPDEAKAAVAQSIAGVRNRSLAFHRRTLNFEDERHLDRFATALRGAGLPE